MAGVAVALALLTSVGAQVPALPSTATVVSTVQGVACPPVAVNPCTGVPGAPSGAGSAVGALCPPNSVNACGALGAVGAVPNPSSGGNAADPVLNQLCTPTSVTPCAPLGALPNLPGQGGSSPTNALTTQLCTPTSVNACPALALLPDTNNNFPCTYYGPTSPYFMQWGLPYLLPNVQSNPGCLTSGAIALVAKTSPVCVPLVPNDCFDLPTYISQSPYTATENIDTATYEMGESPETACNPLSSWEAGSAWFSFTPTQPGQATVSTTHSTGDLYGYGFEPGIVVYTGASLGTLTKVACNGPAGLWNLGAAGPVAFACTPGTTYHIALVSYYHTYLPFGNVKMSLSGCDGTADVTPTLPAPPALPTP